MAPSGDQKLAVDRNIGCGLIVRSGHLAETSPCAGTYLMVTPLSAQDAGDLRPYLPTRPSGSVVTGRP